MTVVTMTGKRIRIGIKPSFTGEDVKWLVQLRTSTPSDMIRLIFGDKRFDADDILSSLDMIKDKTFHMIWL